MTQLGTKKSRKGCTNCKRRRVKCNEQAPCANCTRRGEQCSLQGPAGNHADLSTLNIQGLPLTSAEWLQDLELMHHYAHSAVSLHPWLHRGTIPLESTKHPFLMHGILALSALHIAHTLPSPSDKEKYITLCDRHQSKALELFRIVLAGEIRPEMETALFALSSTISVLSMARSCAEAIMGAGFVGMEQVAELFMLTRGVRDLIFATMEMGSVGGVGPSHHNLMMLDSFGGGGGEPPSTPPPPLSLPAPQGHNHHFPLPASVQRQFILLHRMLLDERHCPAYYRPDCEKALLHLQGIYHGVLASLSSSCFSSSSASSPPRSSANEEGVYGGDDDDDDNNDDDDDDDTVETSHIWRWMLLVPADFVRLISARFPPALVILAHFACVSLARRRRRAWYANDWGHFVLSGISMCLYGSEVSAYLVWPMEQARNHMAVLSQHVGEIDSVMNGHSPQSWCSSPSSPSSFSKMAGATTATATTTATTGQRMPFEHNRSLSLEREILEAELGFISF